MGVLTVFLLIIALVIFTATWVANIMFKMQRDHEEKIKEITKQNSVQNQAKAGDIESNKDPKLLKGRQTKKEEAYGRFEDEIQIS